MLAEHGTYLVADVYDGDWINEAGARDGWPAETMAKNVQTTEAQRAAFGKAVAAGVRIAYGTDSGVYPHPMVAIQLGYQVRLGQTPLQALRSATLTAAELMGWEDRVGSLRPGRFADLVAVALGPARRHRRAAPARDRRQGRRPGRLRRRPGRGVVDRPCRSGPFVALASGRSSAGPARSRDDTPVSEVVMPAASDERSRPNVRTAPDALAERQRPALERAGRPDGDPRHARRHRPRGRRLGGPAGRHGRHALRPGCTRASHTTSPRPRPDVGPDRGLRSSRGSAPGADGRGGHREPPHHRVVVAAGRVRIQPGREAGGPLRGEAEVRATREGRVRL